MFPMFSPQRVPVALGESFQWCNAAQTEEVGNNFSVSGREILIKLSGAIQTFKMCIILVELMDN